MGRFRIYIFMYTSWFQAEKQVQFIEIQDNVYNFCPFNYIFPSILSHSWATIVPFIILAWISREVVIGIDLVAETAAEAVREKKKIVLIVGIQVNSSHFLRSCCNFIIASTVSNWPVTFFSYPFFSLVLFPPFFHLCYLSTSYCCSCMLLNKNFK